MSFRRIELIVMLSIVGSVVAAPPTYSTYKTQQGDTGLGRVKEIAEAVKNAPYPQEAYDLEPYDNPPHIDNAKQEHEGVPSKVISVYDNLHKKTSNFFNPKPVVDGIREEDKYGNNGDKFQFAAKLVTKGFETISSIVNKIVDSPIAVLDKVTKGITTKLDDVGAKIVGLSR